MSNLTNISLLCATLIIGIVIVNSAYSEATDVPNSKSVASFTYCVQGGFKGTCAKYGSGTEVRVETTNIGPF